MFFGVVFGVRGSRGDFFKLRIHYLKLIINLTMIKSHLFNCIALLGIILSIIMRTNLDQTLFGIIIGALTLFLFPQIQKYGFKLTFWPGEQMRTALVSFNY